MKGKSKRFQYHVITGSHGAVSADQQLVRDLLDLGYDPRVRPARAANDSIDIDIQFVLFKLFDLDVRQQVISGAAWMKLIFMCMERLPTVVEETNYGGLAYFNIGSDAVWTPEVIVTNSAMMSSDNPFDSNRKVLISSDGRVIITFIFRFVTYCLAQVENFPFDKHTCFVTISSPTLPKGSFKPRNLSLSHVSHRRNNQWEVNVGRIYLASHYGADKQTIQKELENLNVNFEIMLNRRLKYFILNLVLPLFLLNAMSLVVLFVPAESGEKLSTAVSLLLGVVVFQIIVIDLVPTSNDGLSLLGKYVFVTFVVSCGSVIEAVVTLNIYKSAREICGRHWRQFWFRCMARIAFVSHNISLNYNTAKEPPFMGMNQGHFPGGGPTKSYRYVIDQTVPSCAVTSERGEGGNQTNNVEMNTIFSSADEEPVIPTKGETEMSVISRIISRAIFMIVLLGYAAFLSFWLVTTSKVL
ncbi:acetylcholine receptor subunit beta-like 1 [Diadema antillarum]|uniref:acetylcholine receptor subunit beta-like 1 n=1 Tax=Diadema antillarum TaxID=105358 RepID=UPI003A8B67F0